MRRSFAVFFPLFAMIGIAVPLLVIDASGEFFSAQLNV